MKSLVRIWTISQRIRMEYFYIFLFEEDPVLSWSVMNVGNIRYSLSRFKIE